MMFLQSYKKTQSIKVCTCTSMFSIIIYFYTHHNFIYWQHPLKHLYLLLQKNVFLQCIANIVELHFFHVEYLVPTAVGKKKKFVLITSDLIIKHLATIWIYKQHLPFSDLVLISPFQVKLTSLLLHSWSFPGWTI